MEQYPIVLLHGFWNTHRFMRYWAKQFRSRGRTVFAELDLKPNNGYASIEALAEQLSLYIEENVGKGKPFHLVAFSMGGLVSRYYFQYMVKKERVKSLVTIGTPHNGTWNAYLFNRIGCHQMRPGSNFLTKLNQDMKLLEETSFTSVWARYDYMILPPESSHLAVGKEIVLPCVLHILLPFSKRVFAEVEKAIRDTH